MDLYFSKTKKGATPLKKASISTLISVFYKICETEIVKKEKQEEFYERELFSAFRNIKSESKKSSDLVSYHRRNNILLEIYLKN